LNGTEILRFGGPRSARVALQRRCLQGRNLALIPMGGSNVRGVLGFVNAALELVSQCESGALATPSEVYVATGTLGTAAGLALAGFDIVVRAIRVTETRFANAAALGRLLQKTAELMRRHDNRVPARLAERCRVELRGNFFGGGYGVSDATTEHAIAFAADELGLTLEATYSGKAMAALYHDLRAGTAGRPLFWNTANVIPLDVPADTRPDFTRLPADFARYFEAGRGSCD
jgi:D-cysteine desulfhydrase